MLIKVKRGWELPESAATPESVFHDRRSFIKTAAAGTMLLAAGAPALAQTAKPSDDPSADLYPGKRNPRYVLDRDLTDEKIATTYNNFYEFGTSKTIWQAAQKLPVRPWEIGVSGMVEKPFTMGVDDLLKKVSVEERLYRHRCVERWAMAVPWSGFGMKEFVALCKPTSAAKYVAMYTFQRPDVAPGQKASLYPWPYVEGLTMAEATNDLTFLVTGMYGKPVPRQNGAPLRVATPWKYGFKSIKSIVRFEFTDKRPLSFWEETQGGEYGFWANVNPQVSHPRWSQATEELIGARKVVPTQLFNGYGEFVADLYKDMKNERLYA